MFQNYFRKGICLGMGSFFDTFNRHLGTLKDIGESVDEWNKLLVHITVSSKVDDKSLMELETSQLDTSVPTWNTILIFLNHRCQTLAVIQISKLQGRDVMSKTINPIYALYQCPECLAITTPERVKFDRTVNVCVNCLHGGHRTSSCRSAGCQKFSERHNIKLHLGDEERSEAFVNSVLIYEEIGSGYEI
ncbi:hypothetical protein AGLY_014235 [Aphis glycines]|uniref:Uncharacterized protein n=1 Tax=Aphis glycines TaxID=307491 RepID=A0A6G0T4I6_APHGL|nr:hypothetical protein AGLY_014235 [Aphis glycines]